MKKYIYDNFLQILDEEVVIAQGCTEPIAGALTGAIAKKHLGDDTIKEIKIIASQNIVKNARGVIIPNTDDLMGVEPSVVLGAFFGDPSKNMEVLCNVKPNDVVFAKDFLANGKISMEISDSPAKLFLSVELFGENGNQSKAEIVHLHTNVVYIEENHKKITSVDYDPNNFNTFDSDRSLMTIDSIYNFVKEVKIEDLDLIKKQITLNEAISIEGFKNKYGAEVGRSIKISLDNENEQFDVRRRAAFAPACGSDARMGGSVLPVATVCGSGNQGMTASLPILEYAKDMGLDILDDKVVRAVCLSDLVAIRIKHGVGRLSPLCGVTIASMGAACGILYLKDTPLEIIKDTITNNISNNMGVICDGAKSSCAMKIHSAVETSLLSAAIALNNNVIPYGIGIVGQDIEETIENVGIVAEAMCPIDDAITKIMTK